MSSSTATPDRAMKPIAAEIENGMSRSHRAKMPPTQANGIAREDTQGVHHVVVGQVQQSEDQHEGHRHDDHAAERGHAQVLELSAPFDVVAARRHLHLLGHHPLRLGHETAQIAAADVAGHGDPPLAPFPVIVDGPSTTCTVASRDSGMRSPDGAETSSMAPIASGFAR